MRNTKATMENANRPTKDEFGNPLGRRHATFYEWYPVAKPLKMRDGEPVLDEYGLPRYQRVEYRYHDGKRGRLVPLSYAEGRRRCEGPRGGRGWQYFNFKLYVLDDGTICRFRHEKVDRDELTGEFVYADYWEPYTGFVYGIDGCKVDMRLVDGREVTEAAQSAAEAVQAVNESAPQVNDHAAPTSIDEPCFLIDDPYFPEPAQVVVRVPSPTTAYYQLTRFPDGHRCTMPYPVASPEDAIVDATRMVNDYWQTQLFYEIAGIRTQYGWDDIQTAIAAERGVA